MVGGDTLPKPKPDPIGVWHVQRLSAVPLDRTVLIGDSSIDIQTGRAAGVLTCGVSWGFDARELAQAAPDFLVDSAEELLAVLEG